MLYRNKGSDSLENFVSYN